MIRVKKNISVTDLIKNQGFTQPEIAEAMGKSVTYVSNRCTLKEPWTTDDMIFLADMFELSDDEMLQYFVHPSNKMKNNRRKK